MRADDGEGTSWRNQLCSQWAGLIGKEQQPWHQTTVLQQFYSRHLKGCLKDLTVTAPTKCHSRFLARGIWSEFLAKLVWERSRYTCWRDDTKTITRSLWDTVGQLEPSVERQRRWWSRTHSYVVSSNGSIWKCLTRTASCHHALYNFKKSFQQWHNSTEKCFLRLRKKAQIKLHTRSHGWLEFFICPHSHTC